ncbi:recombinase RecT [Streptosporangium sp. NPDC051023]|uniref:recombinase RecT n=1 Tax=Streptosporangium sp. NPDC051023 TaxID=3155410 RepID=UPI00344C16FE
MTVLIKDPTPPAADLVGPLTIQPGQTKLTPLQAQAFRAITNFDPRTEPDSWPHINVFLQLCVELQLSPWARKIHLYKRGEGEHARYVIQTGIHGLTELAQRTGRFIRFGETEFTSDDDAPAWWHLNPVTGKRERVWVSTWIWPGTHPAAARTTIHYYDHKGVERSMTAEIAWQSYAPYRLMYEGQGEDRRKVIGDNGIPMVELEEHWARDGGIHMIKKCSRANLLRLAFPAQCGNVFIDEELHAEDVRLREERALQVAATHTAALAHAQRVQANEGVKPAPRPVNMLVNPAAGVHDEPTGRAPARVNIPPRHLVIHTLRDVNVHASAPTPEQIHAWLLEEIHAISAIIDRDVSVPIVRRYGQPEATLDDLPAAYILNVLGPLRASVAATLRQQGRHTEAAAYAAAPHAAAPVEVLFGRAAPCEERTAGPAVS